MSRITSIKRLAIAALASAGVVVACRAAHPGEAPPLAPRPDIGKPTDPVPGGADPLAPPSPTRPGPKLPTNDAGPTITAPSPGPVSQIDPPIYRSSAISMQPGFDAGTGDATTDAGMPDARIISRDARQDAAADASVDATFNPTGDARADGGRAPRDGRVPDAEDSGVNLPRNPDASLPGDAARPLR